VVAAISNVVVVSAMVVLAGIDVVVSRMVVEGAVVVEMLVVVTSAFWLFETQPHARSDTIITRKIKYFFFIIMAQPVEFVHAPLRQRTYP
jgi:hypothetical protein